MKGQISSNLYVFLRKDNEELFKKEKERIESERDVKINTLLKYYRNKKERVDFKQRLKEIKSFIELDLFLDNELKIYSNGTR